MFFAKNSQIDNLEIYISFLTDIIEKDNQKFKELFQEIFKNIHQLSTEQIDYTSVPSEIFDIVTVLTFNHKEYFRKINLKSITKKDYSEIKEFLKQDMLQLA